MMGKMPMSKMPKKPMMGDMPPMKAPAKPARKAPAKKSSGKRGC